jgi:transposase
MEIRKLILHMQQEPSNRQIERDTAVDRRTVKRYREWAAAQGLLTGPLPTQGELERLLEKTLPERQPPQNQSSAAAYREVITQLLKEQVQISAIFARIQERGYQGSYAAVRRLARQIDPPPVDVVVRVERQPGEEAQVDFGYVGMMKDDQGKVRKAWAFVMVLAWSRHLYVEFVFDQKIETWLRLHRNALEYLGGVPKRMVIDNLKAGITQAVWEDPVVQRAYQECAEHYGFLIAPCRPATPQHKGKVENGVAYVQGNFMGGRGVVNLAWANQEVRRWCQETAGMRIHGTTKEQPWERFTQIEQARLKPLPETPYDLAIWKQVKAQRDCYVVFEGSFYSFPFRYVGQTLWVCGGTREVRLFNQAHELLATHERAPKPGTRQTHPNHLPPEKLPGLKCTREGVLQEAAAIGPATQQLVQRWLENPTVDLVQQVGKLLRLGKRYSPDRLEAACQRALQFDDLHYRTIKTTLEKGLDRETPAPHQPAAPAQEFVRSTQELVGELAEVSPWN